MPNSKRPSSNDYLNACQRYSAIFLEDLQLVDIITKVLAVAGETAKIDRVFIYKNTFENEVPATFQLQHLWTNEKISFKINTQALHWSNFIEIQNLLTTEKKCVLSGININSNGISNLLRIHSADSMLLIPIFIHEKFWGFTGFESTEYRSWQDIDVTFFNSIVMGIGTRLKQEEFEVQLLNQANYIETKLSENDWLNFKENNSNQYQQIADLKSLAMIAQKSHTVVMLCNADFTIKWVNEAFTKTFEFEVKDALGKIPLNLFSGPETELKQLEQVQLKLEKGLSVNFEVLNYTKSGRKVWALVDITPLYDQQNSLLGYIIIETDISEKKKAEAEIKDTLNKEKKLNVLKTKFVSLASHEFRTPLAGIQLSADIINLLVGKIQNVDIDTQAKLNKHVSRISSEIFRMTEIMNNVLLMGKIDAERVQFYPAENDLFQFLEDNIKQSFSNLPNGRKIKFTCQGNRRNVLFDKTLMDHILKNLLSNALKYSEGKADPEINLFFDENEVVITVVDFGIGIPEGEQSSIFQSFFRASNTVSIQGIGLGMVIIKQFIEQHNGTISFKSELNKGTTFKLTLPY